MGTADVHHEGPWSGRPGAHSWRREAKRTNTPLLRRPTSVERRARQVGLTLLVVVTLAAALGCLRTYQAGSLAERADAGRRPVQVTVVRQVQPTGGRNIYLADALLEVTYEVDGVTRTATMPGLFGAAVGAHLDAWVDHEGHVVPRPQTRQATLAQTGLAAAGGLTFLIGLAVGGQVLLSAWSMRLRAREWEAEWLAFDTGRAG